MVVEGGKGPGPFDPSSEPGGMNPPEGGFSTWGQGGEGPLVVPRSTTVNPRRGRPGVHDPSDVPTVLDVHLRGRFRRMGPRARWVPVPSGRPGHAPRRGRDLRLMDAIARGGRPERCSREGRGGANPGCGVVGRGEGPRAARGCLGRALVSTYLEEEPGRRCLGDRGQGPPAPLQRTTARCLRSAPSF